ncbi:hypothetical protein Q5P01_025226 [Channa striata]|uniref:C3H1-type domain-containing protein n=1 Tax=Channa striata TaxID=64152 RepID=A0AA88LH46_CHASR|nr:hypothetical protein Q5P01_025226 [Channa striata]
MNSLVGYGVSSESDSDGDTEDGDNSGLSSCREVCEETTAAKKSHNFLLESASASSDSCSESESEEQDPDPPSPSHSQTPALSAACQAPLTLNKLPPPPLNACSDSSVFANPFKAQADQNLSALQKHVPLTLQAKPSQIGGKRVCVSYRKDGRCRFGIKCKFAHDSDLQTPVTPADCHPPVTDEAAVSEPVESHIGGSCNEESQGLTGEEKSGGQQVKKRRVGLSNTLIPPKRAMKQYTQHRDRERINMS